jgi:nucleotide-binding universal stress UspA family protein
MVSILPCAMNGAGQPSRTRQPLALRPFPRHHEGETGGDGFMRTYLVVIDESAEAQIALRFAARRAVKTGGGVEILSLIPKPDFVQWGGVMATIEEEARQRAEALVAGAAGTLIQESGLKPTITLREGDGPKIIRELIDANPEIAALVLGVAVGGKPGALVTHFTSSDMAALPVPLMLIPGSLDRDAIDRLS